MGFMSSGDRQTVLDAIAAREPETGLGFADSFAAADEESRLLHRSDSLSYQLRDGLVKSITRARDLGLNPPPLPTVDTWSNRQVGVYADWLDTRTDAIAALRSDLNGPPDPFLKTGAELRREAAERVALASERASRAGTFGSLAGSAWALGSDVPNLAVMAMAPGIGAAETVFGRLGIEFVAGSGSQLAVEAASLPAKESAGVAPTAGQMAGNVLLTGAVGTVAVPLFHGIGLAARRLAALEKYHAGVRSGEIIPNRETEAAADAIQDHLDTVKPGASPQAELAQLEATDAAAAAWTAEHPTLEAAALRTLDEKTAAAMAADPLGLRGVGSMGSAIGDSFRDAAWDALQAGKVSIVSGVPELVIVAARAAGVESRAGFDRFVDDWFRPGRIAKAAEAAAEAPTVHVPEPPLVRGEAAPAPAEALDEATRASFEAAIEANPDLRASYQAPDGPVVGSARELMQAAKEEESFGRQLLDCLLSGGKEVAE